MNEVVGRVPSQGRNTFIKNAMILSLGGILVKVLGFYRIPLAAILGPVGMGLFQYAYPIFNALLAISAAASIPTAISKMVSERLARRQFRSAQKIFQVALVMLFILGAMGTVIMIAGARFVAEVIIGDPRAYFPLVAIAPAILIVSVMASLRGYFQGMQTMVPSAASQVVEQAGRVLAALILAYLLLPRGLEFAAGGASFGVVIGSAFGLALLALLYWYRGQQLRFPGGGADEPGREGVGRIALEITRLSVPITLAALVSPIIQLIDTVIVPRRLQIAGFTPEAATGLYGQLTGFAAPLMNLPQIFTVALAASLVPAVSEALALGQSSRVRNRVEAAMKLTLLIALPSTLGLILLARPISQMLYNTPEAGIPLAGLAAGITFLLLHQTTTGALQGLGKTHIPVQNLLLGAAVKAVMNFTLTAIPSIHILGAALGTSAGFLVAAVLNVIALRRLVGFPFPWRDGILKPMLASAAMALTVTAFYRTILELYGSNTLGTLIAIAGGAGIYGAVLILSKAVTEEELQMIPWFGPRFNEILRRLGLTGR